MISQSQSQLLQTMQSAEVETLSTLHEQQPVHPFFRANAAHEIAQLIQVPDEAAAAQPIPASVLADSGGILVILIVSLVFSAIRAKMRPKLSA